METRSQVFPPQSAFCRSWRKIPNWLAATKSIYIRFAIPRDSRTAPAIPVAGRDLNRQFWTGSHDPEVQLLERQIRTLRFDGLIALHADGDSSGLYAYALGAQVTQHVVEPALQAAEKIVPRNLDPTIDNFTARNGLIRKGYPGMLCAAPEMSPRPFEIVFETPQNAELEKQIEANLVFSASRPGSISAIAGRRPGLVIRFTAPRRRACRPRRWRKATRRRHGEGEMQPCEAG